MTAAHCVHQGRSDFARGLFKNIIFQPSHPDHGTWYRVKQVFVLPAWISHGVYHADVAILVTDGPMGIVDFWGVQTRLPVPSEYGWTTYGYPARPPFDGQYPYTDGGPETNAPWSSGELKFEVKAIDNHDLTPGCSGGPWITNGRYAAGDFPIAGNDTQYGRPFHINGLNSFTFDNYPGIMVSPAFSRAVLDLVNTALTQISLQV